MIEKITPGNETPPTLMEFAERLYEEYDMDGLPDALKRNSLDYYYLSVYPGLQEMPVMKKMPEYPSEVTTMYIHTPFCSGICNFCSYFVKSLQGDFTKLEDYFKLLKKEFTIHSKNANIRLNYVYFGGGTPSLIPPHTLDDFLGFLQDNGVLQDSLLGTFELHPEFFEDLDNAQKFIDVIKKYGITRVSIGYESSSEKVLEETNRRHKKDFLGDAVAFLRENNLSFNIDLMYGMPGMSLKGWEQTLMDALSVKPDSVTPYFLFVDKRTGMYKNVKNGIVTLPTHKEIQTQHIMSQVLLAKYGYHELPNDFFARIDGEFDEELLRQDRLPSDSQSLPLGAGSYGFMGATQFYNQFNISTHESTVLSGKVPIWKGLEMDNDTLLRRDIMFLFKNGHQIVRELFVNKYNKDIVQEFQLLMNRLEELNLIIITDTAVSLTRKGSLLVEEIACQFKDPRITKQDHAGNMALQERHNFSPEYKKMDL